ncbi:putative Zn-finger protein [Rhodovulum iodosum]|uniref:Zn-finger protein n=1 Tax=Rhodovulum iodosum TaxID=68291 RepID=A0ABV3XQ54_9RHOB|nr:zinc-finger domain-containing protein [Rhodovulum robiginosum]RSK31288.1 zinc-finger domain-containing protein [Rhodovulum robiginosum]
MPVEAPGQDEDTPAPETEIVSKWRVACDGSGPALGHPRVWLQIPQDKGWVECGYCDKKFIHESFAGKVK